MDSFNTAFYKDTSDFHEVFNIDMYGEETNYFFEFRPIYTLQRNPKYVPNAQKHND